MFLRLLLLLTAGAIVELWLLLYLAKLTSPLLMVAVVVGTAIAGMLIARRQGLNRWRGLRQELSQGKAPASGIIDSVLILVAAVLLITPGILADLTGILLLIPQTRRLLRHAATLWISRRISVKVQNYTARYASQKPAQQGDVIDAEFTHLPPDTDPRLP